jgi:peptidoglycan/LPS O-acetylase OafA/YrhL
MSRAPALDGLRGIAALSIVVLHAWLYTTTSEEKADSALDGAVHQFRLGVPLFFVLSGFLLYRAWVTAVRDDRRPPHLATYARRRAWRIVPAYGLALVGSLALLALLGDVRGVNVPDAPLLALFAVFASNLHPETVGALDPPMWTLAVEVQFYVLLPLLAVGAAAAARRGPRWVLLVPPVLLLAGGTAYNLHTAGQAGSVVVAASLMALAPCFACGMAAAVVADRAWLQTRAAAVLLAVGGAALVVADGAWHEADAGPLGRILRDLPAAAGFAAIVLVAAGPWRRRLASRPLQLLGTLSFPIYLWHMPLMLGLRGAGLFPEGRPVAAFAAVMAVTLPVAWCSWALVERPALRWSGARERRRRATRPLYGLHTPAPMPHAMGFGAAAPPQAQPVAA